MVPRHLKVQTVQRRLLEEEEKGGPGVIRIRGNGVTRADGGSQVTGSEPWQRYARLLTGSLAILHSTSACQFPGARGVWNLVFLVDESPPYFWMKY